jgi:hypothetical protein
VIELRSITTRFYRRIMGNSLEHPTIEYLMSLSERTRWAVEDAQILIGAERQERVNDAHCFVDQLRDCLIILDRHDAPACIIDSAIAQMNNAISFLELL